LASLRETHSIGHATREWLAQPRVCPALARHRIALTGISDARHGFEFIRLNAAMSQVLICHAGEGRVLVEGRWRRCGEGMAYLTPPRRPHAYHALPRKKWLICWVTYGEPGNITPVVDAPAAQLLRVDPRPLFSAIQGLYWESVGAASAAVMEHSVELIQLLVSRIMQPYHKDDRLWRVWSAVDADLNHEWSLDELASVACMSAEHLRRLSQRQLGRSPLEQVRFLRMRKAAALLTTTPDKIESISYQIGYHNPFAFSTAFKHCMGMSPAQFRSQEVRGGR
jgi:AraC-like DNA-binding protein